MNIAAPDPNLPDILDSLTLILACTLLFAFALIKYRGVLASLLAAAFGVIALYAVLGFCLLLLLPIWMLLELFGKLLNLLVDTSAAAWNFRVADSKGEST